MTVALLTALLACFLILWTRTSGTILSSILFFSAAILIPVATLLRDFLWKFYKRQFKPRAYHIVQEMRAVEIRRELKKFKSSMASSSIENNKEIK